MKAKKHEEFLDHSWKKWLHLNTSARAQREDGETKCVAGRHPERSGVLETEERRAIRAECSPAEARRRRGREAGDPGTGSGSVRPGDLTSELVESSDHTDPRPSLREVPPPLLGSIRQQILCAPASLRENVFHRLKPEAIGSGRSVFDQWFIPLTVLRESHIHDRILFASEVFREMSRNIQRAM